MLLCPDHQYQHQDCYVLSVINLSAGGICAIGRDFNINIKFALRNHKLKSQVKANYILEVIEKTQQGAQEIERGGR